MSTVVVRMFSHREVIVPFERVELLAGEPRLISTIPPLPNAQEPNILIPLLRFICNPEIASKLLVKISIEGLQRTSHEFVSAALASLISLNVTVDPSKPIELGFMATEKLVVDCGIVCKMRSQV